MSGSDRLSAFWKSSAKRSLTAPCSRSPSPNCSTRIASCRASTFFDRGRARRRPGPPPRRRRPRSRIRPAPRAGRRRRRRYRQGFFTSRTCACASTVAIASRTAARNCGSPAYTVPLCTSTLSSAALGNASWSVLSARPDSPGPPSSCSALFVPMAPPTITRTITKASQPQIAVLRWDALQRAARAAMFLFSAMSVPPVFEVVRGMPGDFHRERCPSNSGSLCPAVRLTARALCPRHTSRSRGAASRIAPRPRSRKNPCQMRRTVLIVDDHSGFRASARELLECEGYEVVGEADDAASAVTRDEGAETRHRPARHPASRRRRRGGLAADRSRQRRFGDRPGLEPRRIVPRRRARGVPRVRVHPQVGAERRGARKLVA